MLGLNGAGKTTLLRILAGETEADLGFFDFGYHVEAGYYAQEHDNLDGNASLLDNLRADMPPNVTSPRPNCVDCSACSGCRARRSSRRPGSLSGGEKTKLALAMLMSGRNNLLLLDEPTNNLDPPSRQSVAEALKSWKGAIIFVSHDTEFVTELAPTKVLLLPDGDLDYFDDDWLELVSLA